MIADTSESADYVSALIQRDEVISLLDELPEYEKRLIRLHYGYNNTFEEIADKIGGAPSTLRVHCNAAVAKLQRLIERMKDDNASEKAE